MSKVVIISLMIIFLGFLLNLFNFNWVDQLWWKNVDAFATALTLVLVFIEFYANRKQLDNIKIKFKLFNNDYIIIDERFTRKDCQRSEIQGLLRTKLIKGQIFYDIDYLADENYFNQIFEIQNGVLDELVIDLKEDEISQFADCIVAQVTNPKEYKNIINEYIEESTEKPKRKLGAETEKKLKD